MNRREFLTTAASAGAAAIATTRILGAQAPTPQNGEATPKKHTFKLRYAPHMGMFANHAKDDADQIAFFADQGFTAFEDNGFRGRPKEQQEKIAKALEKYGVAMGVFVAADNAWGAPTLTTGDAGARDKFLANIKESVEVAKRCRAKWMTVVPGTAADNVPVGIQTANVIETLKRAAAIFEPHGLVMVNEPLNWRDHPGQFLRYSDQAYALMKAVASPACKILFDMYHQQVTEGNLIPNIDRCWDEIGYFQIGDNPGRCEPGTGEVNYRNVFKHIQQKGYAGILGMEHGNSKNGREGELAVIEAYVEADRY